MRYVTILYKSLKTDKVLWRHTYEEMPLLPRVGEYVKFTKWTMFFVVKSIVNNPDKNEVVLYISTEA